MILVTIFIADCNVEDLSVLSLLLCEISSWALSSGDKTTVHKIASMAAPDVVAQLCGVLLALRDRHVAEQEDAKLLKSQLKDAQSRLSAAVDTLTRKEVAVDDAVLETIVSALMRSFVAPPEVSSFLTQFAGLSVHDENTPSLT
jgi:hypothetical protein